jgi:hypothetical protein
VCQGEKGSDEKRKSRCSFQCPPTMVLKEGSQRVPGAARVVVSLVLKRLVALNIVVVIVIVLLVISALAVIFRVREPRSRRVTIVVLVLFIV